jgi:tetratricopeptide (TPR) repeat protein
MLRDPLRSVFRIERGEPESMARQLTTRIKQLAPDLLPMASLVGDLMSIPIPLSKEVSAIDVQFRPDRRAETLIRLLEKMYPDGLTFVVDEAHWCDEATAHLLSRLESACEDRSWLLLAARRDVNQGFLAESARRVDLGLLPDEDMRMLIRVATDAAPLRAHEIDAVARRAGGYPLFAEEIIRASREAGSLDAVPESLEAAMAIQVDALDRSARRVLQFASILGRSFSLPALERLLESEERSFGAGHMERLAEFLVPEGKDRYQFRSGMLRDTVYEGVAYRLKRKLHQLAGEHLESSYENPEEVADGLVMHFYRAGDMSRSWVYGRAAGDRARVQHANADAARYYEIALEAARRSKLQDPEACRAVWLDLAEARTAAGVFEAAADAFRQALKLAGYNPLERAGVLFRFAKLRDRAGAPSAALRDLTLAEKFVDGADAEQARDLRAELASFRANVLFGQDRLEKAVELADLAVGVAEAAEAPAPLAEALMIRESARTMLEGPGDGSDLRRALNIYESLGELVPQGTVLTNLGVSIAFDGRWDEAMSILEDARARYEQGGNSPEAALAAANIADLLLCQGHITRASELLEEALPVVRGARWSEGLCGIQIQLGHVRIEQGRFGEAEALLVGAGEEFHRIGQPAAESEATLLRAAGRLLVGELEEGLSLLDASLGQAGGDLGMFMPRESLLRGIGHAKSGDLAQAILCAMRGIEQAREFELHYELGLISDFALMVGMRGEVLTGAEQKALKKDAGILSDLGVVATPRSFSWDPD